MLSLRAEMMADGMAPRPTTRPQQVLTFLGNSPSPLGEVGNFTGKFSDGREFERHLGWDTWKKRTQAHRRVCCSAGCGAGTGTSFQVTDGHLTPGVRATGQAHRRYRAGQRWPRGWCVMDIVESKPQRPSVLIPVRFRIAAWSFVAVCLLVLVVLAVHYHNIGAPGWIDVRVENWLRTDLPDSAGLLHNATYLGNWPFVLVMTLLVACFGYFAGRWKMVLLAVLGPVVAIALTEGSKPLIGRTIDSYFALPSGHATAVVSLLTVACVLSLNPRRREIAVVGVLIVLALTVGFVVMAAGLVRGHFHYATDILAGSCVGVSVVLLLALVLDRFARRNS
jgi:membrane-associated phospholipid phosphatase